MTKCRSYGVPRWLKSCPVLFLFLAFAAINSAESADPNVDDFTEHTYAVGAGPIGSFADLPISRTFSGPISSIRVTIVSGTADDIGFVGSLQVTDAPPSCSNVGHVVAPIDVTSQVTVSGNTASLLLRAQENCCCVTGWGQATQSDRSNARLHWEVSFGAAPKIEITLVPEPPGNQYVIGASPSMPTIQAKARVVGVSPDPTPATTFSWTANLTVHENVPSQDVDFASDIVQNSTTTGEALYMLRFNDSSAFRGGDLKLKATATVNGNSLTGETPAGLKIVGTNPQRTTFQSYIDQANVAMGHGLSQADVQDVLKRMACRESIGQRQFNATANGGIGPALISDDDGVGLFQITNSPCDPFRSCRDVMFNWQENADAGIRAFREKVGSAGAYPRRVRQNQQYQDFVENTINPQRVAAGRRPLSGAPAPGWTTDGVIGSDPPNQLLEDSVRGYNGFAGTNHFGLALHEFTPDTNFLLNATDQDLRGINNDARVWRRVLATERPATGDRHYVNNVAVLSPQCGG